MAEKLLSQWLAERKTRPDGWFTDEELNNVVNLTCREVVRLPAANCPKQALAIYTSLRPLATPETRRSCEDLARHYAYLVASNFTKLRNGDLLAAWVGSLDYEWSVQTVLSVTSVDPNLPLNVQTYKVRTLVLSGSASGCVIEKLYAKRVLVFLAPKLGFGKRPNERHGDRVPPKFPRLLNAEDIEGLLWYAMLQPGNEYPPRYFELRCTPAMIKHNREIIRDRRVQKNGGTTTQR